MKTDIAELKSKADKNNNVVAQHTLGVLLEARGKIEEAKKWYEKAANKNYSIAQYHLGVLLAKEGQEKESKFWLKKATYNFLSSVNNQSTR